MHGYRLSKALNDMQYSAAKRAEMATTENLRTRYGLSDDEIDAVQRADLTRLYELGANPYLIRFAFRDAYND